ncbi:AAA family ATPase [Candidatus Woesearchaeota archaeon]|nr:AAA family ATPase [Candidatus Woesearchaeota archaeon]
MKNYKQIFDELQKEAGKIIVGQESVVEQILTAILCDGNALLEGYPGLAKTLTVRTLAQLMDLKFSRIQNTPDLMPSDITGTYIIEETSGKRQFKFQPGPIFANVVLADEINRATPKTQSALLEAMQEKQVTVGTNTFKLDLPFFVLATQNPIEQEGSLSLNQAVFVNGQLKTGEELLEIAQDRFISEDSKGIKLYDINAWTFALNPSGKLGKQKCLLYTLPYSDEMIVITTKTGKRIVVTKNHPFLVNEHGAITWKKAEELTKYDYLVNPAKLPSFEQQKVTSHEEAIKRMAKPIPKEIPFDEDFAFWIAFLLSDGSVGEKHVEAVQKNYPEALDRFVEVSKKYGFKPSVAVNRGCRYARIYSKPLVEYLSIRFGISNGKDKEIPAWFLGMPTGMNKEFLKTFISLESSLRDNRVVFTQKSAKNTNIISYMLLREGILSWVRHDGRIFRLKIQGKDFISFIKKNWLDNL